MAAQRKTRDQLAAELEIALAELETLRAMNGDAVQAVKAFKERVKKKAMEAKVQYEWCDEVDQILKELGIDPAMPRFRFTAMIPVTIEATIDTLTDQVTPTFVASSIKRHVIQEALEDLGRTYRDSEDGILDQDWDTYTGYDSKNSWSLEVGDIEVKDLEQVTG